MAKVAYLPFPVSFLHALPAMPSRHTQLVETQLSTIKVTCAGLVPPPLLESAFKVTCARSASSRLEGLHVFILFAFLI